MLQVAAAFDFLMNRHFLLPDQTVSCSPVKVENEKTRRKGEHKNVIASRYGSLDEIT